MTRLLFYFRAAELGLLARELVAWLALCLVCSVSLGQHPAVVRVVVDDGGSQSLGSGAYVDTGMSDGKEAGLVVTNHHVIRDRRGSVSVVFPDGFRSSAKVLGSDPTWDLAALAIWRPQVEPLPLAETQPERGERLTIHGYGSPSQGYRAATGTFDRFVSFDRGATFDALQINGAQARQGDSGGPVTRDTGELVGVLDAAGPGITVGAGLNRVRVFLAQWSPRCGPGGCSPNYGYAQPQAPRYPIRTPVTQSPANPPRVLPYRDNSDERLRKIENAIAALQSNESKGSKPVAPTVPRPDAPEAPPYKAPVPDPVTPPIVSVPSKPEAPPFKATEQARGCECDHAALVALRKELAELHLDLKAKRLTDAEATAIATAIISNINPDQLSTLIANKVKVGGSSTTLSDAQINLIANKVSADLNKKIRYEFTPDK